MGKNKISIIIPAYHAGKFLQSTIDKIRSVFKKDIEIIIIVNEIGKDTLSVARKFSKTDERIDFIYFRKRVGKGKAILEGFRKAKGNIIGFVDADAPFSMEDINKNFDLLYSGNYDCLIFSKWKGCSFGEIKQNFIREFLSRLFNLWIKQLFRLNYRDTQGGAKFLKKEVLDKIGYDFICKGFVFDVELLIKLVQKNKKVKELHTKYYQSNVSTINILRDALPVLVDIFRLKKKYCD